MKTMLIALGAALAWAVLVPAALHLMGVPAEARNPIAFLLGALAGVPIGLWVVNQEMGK